MRRLRFGVALILIGAVASLVAGCGGSDPNEATTPANSPTITNGKVSPNEQRANPAGRTGDAAKGGITFNGTCQTCHAKGGTEAATGPKLADRGLTAQAVFDQIANGGTVMHSNLVSGVDVDNVIAYVLSLQKGWKGDGHAAPRPRRQPRRPRRRRRPPRLGAEGETPRRSRPVRRSLKARARPVTPRVEPR